MISGAPPFRGDSQVMVILAQVNNPPPHLAEVLPGVELPVGLDDWLQRALQKTHERRWPDATRMRMALGGIYSTLVAEAPAELGEAIVPLGGDIVPGYADVVNAPGARLSQAIPAQRPATAQIPAQRSATAQVAAQRPATAQRPAVAPARPSGPPPGPALLASGTAVLVLWSDGQRYPGTVVQFAKGHYLIAFANGRQDWIPAEYVSAA
jgi:hypothetical protein